LWDVQAGRSLQTRVISDQSVVSIALSQDDRTLVSGSLQGAIALWSVPALNLQRTLTQHGALQSVVFSPKEPIIATGGSQIEKVGKLVTPGEIKLWNSQNGELLSTLVKHSDRVSAIAVSPDGRLLASGGWDQTIVFWEVQTGKLLRVLQAGDEVSAIAFSPNGKTLASGHVGRTIRLWDVQNGQVLKILNTGLRGGGWITSIAFSPNGKILASSEYSVVKLWNIEEQKIYD
jgi:WD40 repeat protein